MKAHKKLVLSISLVLCLIITLNAQTTWDLTGNALSTTGQFIGTTTAYALELKTTNTSTPQPINFYTNNEPRMSITGGRSYRHRLFRRYLLRNLSFYFAI